MSIFSAFNTDETLEKDGVEVDFGDFSFIIARAGGANEAYEKRLSELSMPYRRQMEAGTLSPNKIRSLLRKVYAETVVKGWDERTEAEVGKFSPAVCEELFAKYPTLFEDVMKMAGTVSIYRRDIVEAAAKNSLKS